MDPYLLEGYPTFAEFIAQDRDASIYRKFQSLSARNLLYQQSALHDLERQSQEIDHEEAKDLENENAQKTARYWSHFANDQSDKAKLRRDLQETIKVKIKEYHEAIVLESQVLALSAPAPRTLEDFRRWYKSTSVPVLWGHDSHLFEDSRDLIALAPVDTDRLNVFLKSYFGWFLKEKRDGKLQRDIFYIPERRIQSVGAIVSALMSAILLIGAIVCLLLVSKRSLSIRVGMVVLFTSLFAGVVGLLTNARRAEIFGSSAAYAAVLVVFVSNIHS